MTHRIDYKSTNVDGYGIVEEWITVHVVRNPLGWRGVCRDNRLEAYNDLTFTTYRAPCNGRPSWIDAFAAARGWAAAAAGAAMLSEDSE